MECKDLQAYYPTLNYITIEKIKDFNVKATGVDKKLPHLNKKWIKTRRALGIKALYAILKRFYNEDCRVIDQVHDWVLITKGRSKSSELKERILDIELHRLGATDETWKLACKIIKKKGHIGRPSNKEDKEISPFLITKESSIMEDQIPPSIYKRRGTSYLRGRLHFLRELHLKKNVRLRSSALRRNSNSNQTEVVKVKTVHSQKGELLR
ncbi:hypothetical protein H5410_022308 [Solanum commersonii]|uniref:Uncharacterized protein n=1 Tax=Solanum commersonii TaxID=4109 RepID=A0A9J5ZDL2_SOLCO|nr:hypothetical protein H5410_022308 [Solanum commersonii]